ncbi:MAG: hypothetical protein IT294_11105 [Deltaproteobacteria bacterium]|nr:hypothetical protein [Deltaproteobacteria bacterium]
MELTDLSHDERLALVALIETVVASDAAVSDDEAAHVARIAAALGDDNYRALADEADERFGDEAALKTFLSALLRPEARELVYCTVLDAALPDLIDRHESSLLGWLATEWGITVQFEA